MKHVQLPPDGEVLPLDPTTIFFRPADDPLLPHRSAVAIWPALAVASRLNDKKGQSRMFRKHVAGLCLLLAFTAVSPSQEKSAAPYSRQRDVVYGRKYGAALTMDGFTPPKANGKGISLFDMTGIRLSPMTGWVWRFPPNTPLPPELHLVNDKPHHYCIAPVRNMFVEEFKELLDKKAATYLMPDVCRANGYSETLRIGHLAAAYGIQVSPHVAYEISTHVCAALSNGCAPR